MRPKRRRLFDIDAVVATDDVELTKQLSELEPGWYSPPTWAYCSSAWTFEAWPLVL